MRCPECGGHVVSERITLTLQGKEVPLFFRNVPADVCEKCGICCLSGSVAEHIGEVLDEEANPRGFLSAPVVEWETVVLWSGYSGVKSSAKNR